MVSSKQIEKLGGMFALVWNYAYKKKKYANGINQKDICWHIIGKMEESYTCALLFASCNGIAHMLPDRITRESNLSPLQEEDLIKLLRSSRPIIDSLAESFPGNEELRRCDLMISFTISNLVDLIQCTLAKS